MEPWLPPWAQGVGSQADSRKTPNAKKGMLDFSNDCRDCQDGFPTGPPTDLLPDRRGSVCTEIHVYGLPPANPLDLTRCSHQFAVGSRSIESMMSWG
jgi:hypothetical protein